MRILLTAVVVACAIAGCANDPTPPTSSTRVIALNGSLDFGSVIGGESKDLIFSISNSGDEALTVSSISLPAGFTANWSSGTVAPAQSQNVTIRFTPTLDRSYSATITVASNATSGSGTLNLVARGIRTGRVTDPVGDVQTDARVSISPDLTDLDVRATGGVLFITLTFAAGTVTPQGDVYSYVLLDTDENPDTGFPGIDPLGVSSPDRGIIGVEYMITFVDPRGSTTAEVRRVGPSGVGERTGTAAVAFQSANQYGISVPLALLGGDDGRLAFKANAGKWANADQQRIRGFDHVPNVGLPAGLTP